jgi:hypothetical protein
MFGTGRFVGTVLLDLVGAHWLTLSARECRYQRQKAMEG